MIHAISQIITNSMEACINLNYQGKVTLLTTNFLDKNGIKNIQLEIKNNGALIPEQIMNSVFEPYFSTKPNAAGLGLSVAKHIIEQNGGVIELVSSSNVHKLHESTTNETIFKMVFKDFKKYER